MRRRSTTPERRALINAAEGELARNGWYTANGMARIEVSNGLYEVGNGARSLSTDDKVRALARFADYTLMKEGVDQVAKSQKKPKQYRNDASKAPPEAAKPVKRKKGTKPKTKGRKAKVGRGGR